MIKNGLMDMKNAATMSSLEIAELCGKRHDNVMANIRQLLDTYGEMVTTEKPVVIESSYKTGTGKMYKMYKLDEDATLDLVMGYSQPLRIKIRQEWRALKTKPVTHKEQYYQWHKIRQEGKLHRVASCKAMSIVVGKMISEGSTENPPALYARLTSENNRIMFDQKGKATNWRDCMNDEQLTMIKQADNIIMNTINEMPLDASSDEIIEVFSLRLGYMTKGVGRSILKDELYIGKKEQARIKRLYKRSALKLEASQKNVFD